MKGITPVIVDPMPTLSNEKRKLGPKGWAKTYLLGSVKSETSSGQDPSGGFSGGGNSSKSGSEKIQLPQILSYEHMGYEVIRK